MQLQQYILKYLLILCLSFSFIACEDDDDNDNDGQISSREFMQKTASSNMFEISSGRLAEEKASTVDVKEFGQHMVEDHTTATNELKALAASKNVTLPDTMDVEKQQKYANLEGKSGLDFDKTFMDEMVQVHQQDVNNFEEAAEKADDADVRAWAAKLLPTLRMHLDMAEDLREDLNN